MTQQVFEIFRFSQTFEIHKLIETLFPTASSQFIVQLTTAFDTFISKTTSAILNNLVNVFLSLPKFLLNIFIVGFVCFFTLKDYDSLKGFMSEISPFGKSHENVVIKQFKRITDSVIYGQVVVGILQGVLAGVALILLNVPNSIVLTVVAIILSIVPFVGPAFVWIPTAIYLFYIGKSTTLLAIFVIYNLLIVSNIDNLVRAYIVSKKSEISSAIILVGMIGGLFMFGLLGLILGPLILAYFLVLLKSYKDNDLHNIFSD
jgi:predicted PurR-regulated permease PerM